MMRRGKRSVNSEFCEPETVRERKFSLCYLSADAYYMHMPQAESSIAKNQLFMLFYIKLLSNHFLFPISFVS